MMPKMLTRRGWSNKPSQLDRSSCSSHWRPQGSHHVTGPHTRNGIGSLSINTEHTVEAQLVEDEACESAASATTIQRGKCESGKILSTGSLVMVSYVAGHEETRKSFIAWPLLWEKKLIDIILYVLLREVSVLTDLFFFYFLSEQKLQTQMNFGVTIGLCLWSHFISFQNRNE